MENIAELTFVRKWSEFPLRDVDKIHALQVEIHEKLWGWTKMKKQKGNFYFFIFLCCCSLGEYTEYVIHKVGISFATLLRKATIWKPWKITILGVIILQKWRIFNPPFDTLCTVEIYLQVQQIMLVESIQWSKNWHNFDQLIETTSKHHLPELFRKGWRLIM